MKRLAGSTIFQKRAFVVGIRVFLYQLLKLSILRRVQAEVACGDFYDGLRQRFEMFSTLAAVWCSEAEKSTLTDWFDDDEQAIDELIGANVLVADDGGVRLVPDEDTSN